MQHSTNGSDIHVTFSLEEAIAIRDCLGPIVGAPRVVQTLYNTLYDFISTQPQRFTVTVEMPAGFTANIHEAKNHLRKYVAEKTRLPKDSIGVAVKEVANA